MAIFQHIAAGGCRGVQSGEFADLLPTLILALSCLPFHLVTERPLADQDQFDIVTLRRSKSLACSLSISYAASRH
jgi:hypothetical protein